MLNIFMLIQPDKYNSSDLVVGREIDSMRPLVKTCAAALQMKQLNQGIIISMNTRWHADKLD
tara:strand:- start:421 stop:606 length:186 start_codon:yes stop_codon:yes gene_type:complete